jgi:glycosyltransferase involved in cell wall biosynthesis
VVRNYPLLADVTQTTPLPYRERPPVCAYIGTITRHRGLVEMVDAIGRVPAACEARLVLAGAARPEDLKEVERRPGWQRVDYRGWLDRPAVSRCLSQARVGLVVLHPLPNVVDAYPVKLFEYMAAGVPVVASNFVGWRAFVEDIGAGIAVEPTDTAAIAKAMTWLLEHPAEAEQIGARGMAAARERFNWTSEARSLLEMYAAL